MNDQEAGYFAIIPADVRYDDDLIANAKLLYGEITALCKREGYCWATNNHFAELYNTSEKTISRWISNLEEKGYIATSVQTFRYNDGTVKKVRYIYLDKNKLNHMDKNVQNHMDKKIQDHPDKNVPYNNKITNSKVNKNKINKQELESEFILLWNEYPRKQGRENALKAYIKARTGGVDKSIILNGIKAYKAFLKANKTDSKYIKQGSTWFNQHCWEDDYSIGQAAKVNNAEDDDLDFLKGDWE